MTEQEIRETLSTIEAELKSGKSSADLLNDAGVGYYLLGELKQAMEYLRKAAQKSEKPGILFNLANIYSSLQEPDQAIATFLKVLEKDPGHIGALNNLADEYEHKGELDKAHELFHYLTHLQPDKALSHFNLGNFFLRQNQHIEAAKCYEQALEKDETFVDAYHNIAWILYKSRAYKESMSYIEDGLSFDKNSDDLLKLKKDVTSAQDDTAI
ncbi:tetratricopeptide repeat protein [Rhodohalobacter sp. 8-1]|uniref:tetratricopeptide repeat protein n=1 Tax=Rhodohalobacter sp. 8-1 TaxID=3131972 RepID=UPI0030EB1287